MLYYVIIITQDNTRQHKDNFDEQKRRFFYDKH